ncbi:MAG: flagellar motor protein MotB [Pseudomonadota bacterium]
MPKRNTAAPVVIKRKKVVAGDGHHGGAWKVAYADFVTAMMAFFLLMWLLNATTETQRKGLADYFDPRIPLSRVSGGGSGAFGGDSVFSENVQAQDGMGGTKANPMDNKQSQGDSGVVRVADDQSDGVAEALTQLDNLFRGLSGESEFDDQLLQHVRTRVSDEGLVIELFDADDKPLFDVGSSRPTERMTELLGMVAQVISLVKNDVAVEGHTDAKPFQGRGYGNWELSADRAQSARRTLKEGGVAPDRFQRVTGKAATDPALPDLPEDARNRRVEIILLRTDLTPRDG